MVCWIVEVVLGLEGAPYHAADRCSDLTIAVVGSRVVVDLHRGALGAVGGFGDATRSGVVVEFLHYFPAFGAWFAGFAGVALGVIASVLVQWNAELDVVAAYDVAAMSTVVASEEPGEGFVADVARA